MIGCQNCGSRQATEGALCRECDTLAWNRGWLDADRSGSMARMWTLLEAVTLPGPYADGVYARIQEAKIMCDMDSFDRVSRPDLDQE